MRRTFQFSGITAIVAFGAACLPFYASMTGRRLQLAGIHISAGAFGPPAFFFMAATWLVAVVCLILSLARGETGRWISASLLALLLALVAFAVVILGTH